MHVPSLIEKKRDGSELSSEEIAQVISGFTVGEIPNYQMSALAMALHPEARTVLVFEEEERDVQEEKDEDGMEVLASFAKHGTLS